MMLILKLFWSFFQVGLFTVGGGYAAIPQIQNQAVSIHGWLDMNTFADLVTISEMTPGPIALNAATFVGTSVAGVGGAIAATLGCIFPSILIVSAMSKLYRKYSENVMMQSVLSALRPAVVALIASAGLSILLQVLFPAGRAVFRDLNLQGLILAAIAFVILRKFRPNPVAVIALCGAVGLVSGIVIGY